MPYKRNPKEKEIITQFVLASLHILSSVQGTTISERNREIVRRVMEGETYRAIGESYGLSIQRVNEITRRVITSMNKIPDNVYEENVLLRSRIEALEQELRLVRHAKSKFGKTQEQTTSPVESVLLIDCEMSTRLRNLLAEYLPEVKDVWSLSHLSPSYLKNIPHLGRKTLLEIKVLLGKFCMHLSED